MAKKYLKLDSGYYRFNNRIEINWSIYDWALPVCIDFSNVMYFLYIRILFISVFIPYDNKKLLDRTNNPD